MLRREVRSTLVISLALAGAIGVIAAAPHADRPLAINSARVTIAGTSNIHPYTAATTTVRVTRVALGHAVAGPAFWDALVKPGGLEAFEVAIPAAQLTSPKEGLDKNMHKALKVQEHPEIMFRLSTLEPTASPGSLKAHGILRIAGAEQDVVLDLMAERRDETLMVKGKLDLLMTDYGIKPPTAMLGMLKTDPKVTVTFEAILGVPLT